MPESVIITIICNELEIDMEFPSNVQIASLKTVVIKALSSKELRVSNELIFNSNGYTLKETDTMLSAGIWDGSFLRIT